MDTLVDTLLSRLGYASVQAVLLAAVVYAVCRLVPSLPAAARTLLWWLLGAQLIVGIACPVVLGLPVLTPAPVLDAVPMPAGDMRAFIGPTTASPASSFSWTTVVLAAWIAIVLAQLIIAAVRWQRLAGVLRRAMPHDDIRVETLCARRARALGLRRSPRLACSEEVDSPQVIGLWRPTILLPVENDLDDAELDMALMHELAHVRRGDLVLGCIPALARTLFFFHPLVHVAVREYALCREAACDALVLSRGRQAPHSYGRLLLRLGVSPHPHHALPGASPTFQTLKRRLDMLGQASDARPRVLTWCLVAAIAAVGVVPWRVVAADGGGTTPRPTTTTTSTSTSTHTFVDPAPVPPAPPSPPRALATASIPPVPPAAPAAPMAPIEGFDMASQGDQAHAFVYYGGNVRVMSGSNDDFRRADALRHGDDSFAWYRDGGQAWVLRDPAYLKRIRDIYARAAQPADGAKDVADKMMDIDTQQAALNEQQAKLAERQTEMTARSMSTGQQDMAAYADGQRAIAMEQAKLAHKMAELGVLRARQGATQAAWGRRQAQASREASREVNAILLEAIRNHAAQAAR